MNQLHFWRPTVPKQVNRNQAFVDRMRKYAGWIAAEHGRVTSDDLRRYADRINVQPSHPNVWGQVFRSPEFVQIGTECSSIKSRRGGIIRIWGLR